MTTPWYPRWYYHTLAAAQIAETPEQEQAFLDSGEWAQTPEEAQHLANTRNSAPEVPVPPDVFEQNRAAVAAIVLPVPAVVPVPNVPNVVDATDLEALLNKAAQ